MTFISTLTAHSQEGGDWLSSFTTSEAFLLIIVIAVAGFIVQARLQSVFNKYKKVPLPNGMTGAEIAEKMLRENGVHNVTITHVPGMLTDHFNPTNMTVNLSDDVYSGRSVAAAAVACHECGHAIQHAEAYAPLAMRSALVPVVSFSSRISTLVIIAGMFMIASGGSDIVCWIGVGLIAMSAIFSIVTLPVEYNASSRALEWLRTSHVLQGAEFEGAKISLRWAARTYLVAALSAIASVLYYITLLSSRRD